MPEEPGLDWEMPGRQRGCSGVGAVGEQPHSSGRREFRAPQPQLRSFPIPSGSFTSVDSTEGALGSSQVIFLTLRGNFRSPDCVEGSLHTA